MDSLPLLDAPARAPVAVPALPGATGADGGMVAYNPATVSSMWRNSLHDATCNLIYMLQKNVFDKFRTGHAVLDMLIGVSIFDPTHTLGSARTAGQWLRDTVTRVFRILWYWIRRVMAFVYRTRGPLEWRTRRVEYITENMRKNTVYPAVQFVLQTAVNCNKESGMMLYYEQELPPALDPEPIQLQLAYPASKTNFYEFKGYKVYFKFTKEMKTIYGGQPIQKENHIIELSVELPVSYDKDFLYDFTQHCCVQFQRHLASKKWTPQLFRLSRGTGQGKKLQFTGGAWKNCRKMRTVCLRRGQAEEIMGIIKEFEESEEWYKEHGLPYKLVVLLYGPPGTGKTATINAVCHELKRHKHLLSLSDVHSDSEMFSLFQGVKMSETVVVIEDIDANLDVVLDRAQRAHEGAEDVADDDGEGDAAAATAARKSKGKSKDKTRDVDVGLGLPSKDALRMKIAGENRTEEDDGKHSGASTTSFSLAGLLAFLDGEDAHGKIVFLTTNHPELLDHALLRAGRINHTFLLGHCDAYQIVNLAESHFNGMLKDVEHQIMALGIDPSRYTPADVEDVFVRNRKTPEMAMKALAVYDPTERVTIESFKTNVLKAVEARREAERAGGASTFAGAYAMPS